MIDPNISHGGSANPGPLPPTDSGGPSSETRPSYEVQKARYAEKRVILNQEERELLEARRGEG